MATLSNVAMSPPILPSTNQNTPNVTTNFTKTDNRDPNEQSLNALTQLIRTCIPQKELARLSEEDLNELTTMLMLECYPPHSHKDQDLLKEDMKKDEMCGSSTMSLLHKWTCQRNIKRMICKEAETARRAESFGRWKKESNVGNCSLLQTSLLPHVINNFPPSGSMNDDGDYDYSMRKKLKDRVIYAVNCLQRADEQCPQWIHNAVTIVPDNYGCNGGDNNGQRGFHKQKDDPIAILSSVLPAALLQNRDEEKNDNNDNSFNFPLEWNVPFPSDLSYLAFAEASFILRRQRLALLDMLSSSMLPPTAAARNSSSLIANVDLIQNTSCQRFSNNNCMEFNTRQEQQSRQYIVDIASALDAARVLIESIVQLRLSHHKPLGSNDSIQNQSVPAGEMVEGKNETEQTCEKKPTTTTRPTTNTSSKLMPRIIRLAHRLDLTNKLLEYDALLYIILCNIGVTIHSLPSPPSSSPSASEQRYASHQMAKVSNMNSLDVLDFLDKNRRHMAELLFVPEDEFSTIFNSPFLVVSPEILRVLVGLELSAEDGFKLSDTAVSEMLEEEVMSGGEMGSGSDGNGIKQKSSVMKVEDGFSSDDLLEEEREGSDDNGNDNSDNEFLGDDMALKALIESATGENEPIDPSVTTSSNHRQDINNGTEASSYAGENECKFSHYQTDLDYLEDQFELVETKMRIRKLEMQDKDDAMLRIGDGPSRSPAALLRELHAKLKSVLGKINARMEATTARCQLSSDGDGWLPRMEALAELHGLDDFEKLVILTLVGATISKQVRRFLSGHDGSRSFMGGNTLDVGFFVELGGGSLASQVEARRYFYNHSTLVTEGMVRVAEPSLRMRSSSASTTDIMDCAVELERRLLDHIVGLDTTLSEIQEGTEIYEPQPDTDSVSLPLDQKEIILRTVQHHELLQKQLAGYGFDNGSSGGAGKTFKAGGCVLLFFGKSGTGKTMMAQAVAKHLGKMILSVNIGIVGNDIGGARDTLRFLFREAKIHNAVLFFDECESLFESRDIRSAFQSPVTQFLTEIENYDGLVFLATNRAYELDEALFRRITLTVEFTSPDFSLRRHIWKTHLPPKIPLADDVDLEDIAMQFELTGGLIRQAVIGALSLAYSRDPDNTVVTQQDLEEGARQQLRGALVLAESAERARRPSDRDRERSAVPKASLKDVVLTDHSKKQILTLVHFEKARQLLFAHWGFDGVRYTHTMLENASVSSGTVALFHGPQGCGKTLAAEAVAYELGRTIREISASDLLLRCFSGISGAAISASKWLSSFFASARESGSVIVVKGVEVLLSADVQRAMESYQPFYLSSRANGSTTSFGILETFVQQIRQYTGVTILLSTMQIGSQGQGVAFDVNLAISNLSESIRFAVNFEHPDVNLRKVLWEKLVPSKMPLTLPLDFTALAEQFPSFTGANIRSVVVRTAELAAIHRPPKSFEKSLQLPHDKDSNTVTLKDFERAARAEQRTIDSRKEKYSRSFSHEGIYN